MLQSLSALDAPQQQQQESAARSHQARVATAMQMLGLQQQQQNAGAEQAFRQQQLTQQGQQFDKTQVATQQNADRTQAFAQTQADNKSGEFWGGTMPLQYTEQAQLEAHRKAQEELANKTFNDESGYRWGVKAPMDYTDQATKDRQAKATEDHYGTMNRTELAKAYSLIDPMGNGPKVAASILASDPMAQPGVNAAATAQKAEDLKRYKTLLAMNPNDPSVPPEIKQQLVGSQQLKETTAKPTSNSNGTSKVGFFPSIGNMIHSKVAEAYNKPTEYSSPLTETFFGTDAARQQAQQRQQQAEHAQQFINQLIFGTDQQFLPDSPELAARKRAAFEAMSQRTQQQ